MHCRINANGTAWSGTPPIEREGHSASVVGNRVYIFGGTWVDDDSNSVYLNDLHVHDVDAMAWSQPSTTGEPPSQRELIVGVDDELLQLTSRQVPRSDVARVCVASLTSPLALNAAFDLASKAVGDGEATATAEPEGNT